VSGEHAAELDGRHPGGENLEVMREAAHYNRYLAGLVRRYGKGARTALDFGAGIGTFSSAPDLPADRIYCVEPDASSRAILAAAGFPTFPSLAGVPDASVDYVFTLNVLEHIEDDASAVGALYRVLRPGGILFSYVPAFPALYTAMDRHVGHVRRYRLRELGLLAEGAGFRVERKGYADPLGFFATLLLKWTEGPEPAPLDPRLVRYYDRLCFPLSRLLGVPFRRVLGKNAYIVARRP